MAARSLARARPAHAGAAAAQELGTLRDLRRAQIVAESRRIVAEEGVSALTISTLEGRLPFSRGVITHHFRDKAEIVEAVLQSAVSDIDAGTAAGLRAPLDLVGRVRAVLGSKVRGFLDKPEATRVLVSFWGQLGDPRATVANAALFRRYRSESKKLFAHAVKTGEARADLDPAVAAALLVGAVLGIVSQAMFEPGAFDVATAIDAGAAQIAAWAALRR